MWNTHTHTHKLTYFACDDFSSLRVFRGRTRPLSQVSMFLDTFVDMSNYSSQTGTVLLQLGEPISQCLQVTWFPQSPSSWGEMKKSAWSLFFLGQGNHPSQLKHEGRLDGGTFPAAQPALAQALKGIFPLNQPLFSQFACSCLSRHKVLMQHLLKRV